MERTREWVGRILLLAAMAGLGVWTLRGGVWPAQADPAKPSAKATPQATTAATSRDPRVAELDAQIKALRDQYKAEIDPLEAQVKAVRGKYDAQINTLVDQRKELVESEKSPEIRALDEQEAADLKTLADQERAEIEKVRQKYGDMRKDIQAKYQRRRQELHGAK